MAIRCSDTLTTPDGEQRAGALIAAVPCLRQQQTAATASPSGVRDCPRSTL
jgi:hypothetical protein